MKTASAPGLDPPDPFTLAQGNAAPRAAQVNYKLQIRNYNSVVSDLSVGEKAVVAGRAAWQSVEGAARKNRWTRGLWAGAAAAVRSLARTVHGLFLEVVGVLFLSFALAGGIKTYTAWQRHASRDALAAGLFFTLLFLYFGVSSIWRARRK